MKTTHSRSHWTAMATLGLLTIVGCKVATPISTQTGTQGAAGNGIAVAAGAPAAGPGKTAAAAGTTATASASAGTTATNTAKSGSPAASGEAGSAATDPASASAASGASAQSGSAAGTGAPAKPKNPNAIPACEGKNNEGACDGAKLYYCIDEAPDGGGMSCMSAAMCQVGLKSGKCGECEPGKFKCMMAELQKCDENGQWKLEAMCDSAALCKDTKGICDKSICTEGEYHCSDKDELQICMEDLTGFKVEKPCEKGLCDAKGKKCNECDPMVPKTCESMSSLTTCDMDGKKKTDSCPPDKKYCIADKKDCFECVTDTDCGMAKSECGTRACKDNKCVDGAPKPLRTKCNGTNVCDLTGNCVACIIDDDCHDAQKACLTGVGCVNKIPLTAFPFLGGYSVTVAAGWTTNYPGGRGSATADTTFQVSCLTGTSTGCLTSILAGSQLSLVCGTEGMGIQIDPSLPPIATQCGNPAAPIIVTAERP